MNSPFHFAELILKMVFTVLFLLIVINVILLRPDFFQATDASVKQSAPTEIARLKNEDKVMWSPPDSLDVPATPEGDLIRYGRELVSHTAIYLGPQGTVMRISNGMNCQNCHLRAGTKPFGNNYAAVNATYPKFRARSGTVESVEKRVNDCIERSLNGKALDENSLEMKAFVSYIKWVGKNVRKGTTPQGAGIINLKPLSRPADPARGFLVYERHCKLCHGNGGRGLRDGASLEWRYPPLAGDSSYNLGAGLLRLSRFAGYVKANMPYGVDYRDPVLTDEEAWDVAAYVNSFPRPAKDLSNDWPDLASKPFDHPFGPFADSFSEKQHKFGPFEPIINAAKE